MKIKNKLLLLIVMLTCSFAAAWAQQQQQHITIADMQHGTVTADNTAPYSGETVTLTVAPEHGYKLGTLQVTCVSEGNVVNIALSDIGNGKYTFVMPELDVTVNATFEQILYKVTVDEIPTDQYGFGVGFVMVANTGHPDNMFAEGETVRLLVSADTGYALTTLEVTYYNGDKKEVVSYTQTANDEYEFVMPAADVYVHWIVAKARYTITCVQNEHGVLTADKQTAEFGEEVTLQATTDAHYILTGYKVTYTNGYPVTVNGHKFTMPASNVIAAAIIEPISYNIAVQATEHGSVTAPATADYNKQVEITVTPQEGYCLASIKVLYTDEAGEKTIEPTLTEAGTYTFTMPGANVRIVATFGPATYNIVTRVEPNEQAGAIQVPATAAFGSEVQVTATPAGGYTLKKLYYTYDVGGSVHNPIFEIEGGKFTMPGTDITIVAEFEPVVYNIVTLVQPNDEAGTIQVAASAAFGSEVQVTATPAEGYTQKELYYTYDAGGSVHDPIFDIEGGKFTMPGTDITVVAVFEPVQHNVEVSVNITNGNIDVDKNTAAVGETVTMTVIPDSGYQLETITVTYDDGTTTTQHAANAAPRRAMQNVTVSKVDDTHYAFQMPAGPVTVNATFVREVATGIDTINATDGTPMRYFDLQGRYVGTSLDGARSGVYVTSDGHKVIK